jgi:hypothetical protein
LKILITDYATSGSLERSFKGEGMPMQRGWTCSLALLVTALCGCTALPPAVKLGTLALSGMSYIVTGKGPSDHVISAIAEQDCALLRVIQDRPVCVANLSADGAPVAVAAKSPSRHIEHDAPDGELQSPPSRNRGLTPQYYLVLGSFSGEQNAQRWRRSLVRLDTAIARTTSGADPARARYRVVMGPYREEESQRYRKEVAASLGLEVWRVRLCAATLSAPPCSAPATLASR